VNDIKVFITVEVEKKDIENPDIGMSKANYLSMMDLINELRKQGIPVQYKETDIPRRSGFKPASELINIEKQ